jgi:hypothetical protein
MARSLTIKLYAHTLLLMVLLSVSPAHILLLKMALLNVFFEL